MSVKMSHRQACRATITKKISLALIYNQSVEPAFRLDDDGAAIALIHVMDWLDLYICSKVAVPAWADKPSSAVLVTKDHDIIMSSLAKTSLPWLRFSHKGRLIAIYQSGLRYAEEITFDMSGPTEFLMLKHLDGSRNYSTLSRRHQRSCKNG